MHKLIEDKLNEWAEEDKSYGYGPSRTANLKAVCWESKQPIDGRHKQEMMFTMTKWINGEGFDISINTYNQLTKDSKQKQFSFHTDEIDGLLYCLKDLKYFE